MSNQYSLFFDVLKAKRKDPANCSRCGRYTGGGKCKRCKEYQRNYKLKKKAEGFNPEEANATIRLSLKFERRLALLELSVEYMRKTMKTQWMNGYRAGQKITKEERELLKESLIDGNRIQHGNSIDIQGLQQISHRWQKEA